MKKMKALLVDDEKLARNELRSLLAKFESLEVIGEAHNLETAKTILESGSPDVVFLDIQLQGESGFDLIADVPADVKVIFVTAYDEYAIKAFDVQALDYLTKPIYPQRLEKAVERLIDQSNEEKNDSPQKKLTPEDYLFLSSNGKSIFVKVDSVSMILAAGDYTEVITLEGRKALSGSPMREWEERLPEKSFYRIHRSSIINIDHVDYLNEWFNNSYKVYMKNYEKPLMMSRRYAAEIKGKLKA